MSHGKWSQTTLAGHPLDVFEPANANEFGYAVLYLHGVHLTRLVENATYTELFDRHGLRVFAPITGPTWWTDRICPQFDPQITAEGYVLQHVLEPDWRPSRCGR